MPQEEVLAGPMVRLGLSLVALVCGLSQAACFMFELEQPTPHEC
ncbi:MAG TPA: hypothetical protein VGK67_01795 [Myxococcales bacterium]|jgi:hypothetical protein